VASIANQDAINNVRHDIIVRWNRQREADESLAAIAATGSNEKYFIGTMSPEYSDQPVYDVKYIPVRVDTKKMHPRAK
jgi:hypothetical protein